MTDSATSSTRPYLIRALHEWCGDNGLTPYVVVRADDTVRVPREYVKDGEIVLNVSMDATSGLRLGNDFIEFKARFGGVARDIMIPLNRVMAIYARENGQGMAFPIDEAAGPQTALVTETPVASSGSQEPAEPSFPPMMAPAPVPPADGQPTAPARPGATGRPVLKRVK